MLPRTSVVSILVTIIWILKTVCFKNTLEIEKANDQTEVIKDQDNPDYQSFGIYIF